LGVERSATEAQIKKAYRKLALKLHPDKNKAPTAEPAFKKVSEAFACLSDKEKRAKYNRYGRDNPTAGYRRSARGGDDFVDPQDIFNMFFNGGGPMFVHRRGGRVHVRPQYQGNGGAEGGNPLAQVIHLLPLLLLFLMSWFTLPSGGSTRPFSFVRQDPYRHRFETQRGFEYYVTKKTKAEMRSRFHKRKIENAVEQDMLRQLQRKCHQQKQEKRAMIYSAQRSGGKRKQRMLKKAHEMPLHHCSTLTDKFSDKERQWGL
jgi:DnaJ family protein B protein 12